MEVCQRLDGEYQRFCHTLLSIHYFPDKVLFVRYIFEKSLINQIKQIITWVLALLRDSCAELPVM